MQSALAKVVSAKAGFEKAARDLGRTKIRSPYKCQIRESLVELGSTLAAGSAAAAVDSANDFELRLPVKPSFTGRLIQRDQLLGIRHRWKNGSRLPLRG